MPIEKDDYGAEKISGSIESVIYANEDTGYTICDLGTEDNDLVTILGTMPYLGEGDLVTVWGKWVHNPKYGRQFQVDGYEKRLPADRASILRYLSARTVKGIGPKTAERIVEMFGEETFDVIENHPEWLSDVQGISPKKAKEISKEFANQAGLRSAMMFFRDDFGPAATVKIYKRWGGKAVDLAKSNPYLLCEEIEGIGFEKADRFAGKLGIGVDSVERICSGIQYLLTSNAYQNGHVCLPREKLTAAAERFLGVSSEAANDGVLILLRQNRIRNVTFDGTQYLYDVRAYENEQYIALKLKELNRYCPAVESANVGGFIAREERESGIVYADLQRRAISDALQNGVMLLTGGPGTGKTTVVRALLHIFDSMGMEIALSAPTGRAAKRLSESTSCEAKTVHRLLEYTNEDGRFRFGRDEKNLLEENVVIVDEVSMVDNDLMAALLKAIKPGARLILIGDSDQLPSVGAGNVLHDLLASGQFATVCLTEIFRQAQQSLIVTNAHAINRGEMPRLDVKDNDFFFLPRETDREIALTVAQLCGTRLPKTYGETGRSGTQVICPSRRGESGTENLNNLLQSVLNPPSKAKKELKFRELVFREGDRVMQTRNNYDIEWEKEDGSVGAGIFNGDIGRILRIDTAERTMEILFDEKIVTYESDLLEDLEPAYAITVHKSQGSEYPIVIMPLGSAAPMLLSRNLFYTGVTRAQKMVILVGRTEICAQMVQNNRESMRYTGLAKWLHTKE